MLFSEYNMRDVNTLANKDVLGVFNRSEKELVSIYFGPYLGIPWSDFHEFFQGLWGSWVGLHTKILEKSDKPILGEGVGKLKTCARECQESKYVANAAELYQ